MQLAANLSTIDRSILASSLTKATAALLAARDPEGVWNGELSSSALSTATAIAALAIFDRYSESGQNQKNTELISQGLKWLAENANEDGGWGDTIRSASNLSTTVLCWAAFTAVPGGGERFNSTMAAATAWIERNAGSTEPHQLAPAIIQRYGKDKTFSIPILTMCALSGCLGHVSVAWKSVAPLPFELAALPRSWFGTLRLPVVSYALPALIAIGQVRHHFQPPANPLTRFIRNATRKRTLKVLAEIQPSNGGFLEATPLTSFVAMSLAGCGHASHIVTRRAIDFLRASVRPDGSWAIDSDLKTWVTTLTVNALAEPVADPEYVGGNLRPEERHRIQRWLLKEQKKEINRYTDAAPGGWAWTDLPGGVPDADDTAGALVAIRNLEWAPEQRLEEGMAQGLQWLLSLQNSDGGIPTFCHGWGNLHFDRSSPDLTAHALRAWLAWMNACEPRLRESINDAMQKAVKYLLKTQLEDGTWTPLWFGNQAAPGEANSTYGTSRVLHALSELLEATDWKPTLPQKLSRAVSQGGEWLLKAQNRDGSWSGFIGGPASVEETALAVHALAKVVSISSQTLEVSGQEMNAAVRRGASWLIARIQDGTWTEPAPIGFYFAKLWYYEKMYPLAFTVAALRAVDALLVKFKKRSPNL